MVRLFRNDVVQHRSVLDLLVHAPEDLLVAGGTIGKFHARIMTAPSSASLATGVSGCGGRQGMTAARLAR